MDDLISRSALKEDLLNRSFYPSIVKNALENAPAVDAVEVVRCRECKYYEIHAPRILENCERNGRLIPMLPDDFCSYGERKNKNEN